MKLFRKKQKSNLYLVTYFFVDEKEIYQETATAGGLAMLKADYYVDIISVEKLEG